MCQAALTGVPGERKTDYSLAALDRQQNLIWYPEGEREPENSLLPFPAGIGLLLEHRPIPVNPTIIKGTRRALPIGRMLVRPGRIEIVFGKTGCIRRTRAKGCCA